MEDIIDGLFQTVLKIILGVLRLLKFLACDLLFSYIGWSIGWYFYRILSFGHYPREHLDDLDSCHWLKALLIELTGLGALIFVIEMIANLIK